MIKNNLDANPELLIAFLEPLVDSLVRERVKEELEKRMASLRQSNEPERPISIDKAAEILGYSRSHIYTLCRTKKIPHVKKGRWLYFYVSELNGWLNEDRVV
jgi:excisionase family DNA binding protein